LLLYSRIPKRLGVVKDRRWPPYLHESSSMLRGQIMRDSKQSKLGGKAVDPGYLGANLPEDHRRNLVELEGCGAYVLSVLHRVVLEQVDV